MVCKITFEDWVPGYGSYLFGCNDIYEVEERAISPLYSNGEWYSRSEFLIKVPTNGTESISHKIDKQKFYTLEEWRDLQLKKVLDV